MSDVQSLAHTKWNCKYHVVFAPKYRRQVFYGEKKREIGEILRRLCEWKATPYTRKVISAHTSFGSHAQYRPQETFAQTAPRKMPAPKKKVAG